jgi:DNA-directed RNA polymerase specialized sigma24 family protein
MSGSLWTRVDGSLWVEVAIPSNDDFLKQYHQWIYKKVSDRFRRDKDRVQDTVQNVRVRLLQKDFIGRWFFKHLTHELVDREQAERILGQNVQLKFISVVQPVVGKRSEPDSLWRVSDLLAYAKFDHERYYYSVQEHTISSDSVLRLLGYWHLAVPDPNGKVRDPGGNLVSFKPEAYNVLKSLYKQGRIKPAELTQHECTEQIVTARPIVSGNKHLCSVSGCGKKHFSRGYCTTHYGQHIQHTCPICEKGRASLRTRGVSLADDWEKASAAAAILRWDDSQLRPFLRQWRRQNIVSRVPQKIVRPSDNVGPYQGIDAGLLKYSWIMINNEVVNDFKRMTRTFDASCMVFNDGISPNVGDADTVAWEMDDDGARTQMIVKDASALDTFHAAENGVDVMTLIEGANLTQEESDTILQIDLKELNIREYADSLGVSVAHVHRVRNLALEKMRHVDMPDAFIIGLMAATCHKYGCSVDDMLGPDRVGPCLPQIVRTRAVDRRDGSQNWGVERPRQHISQQGRVPRLFRSVAGIAL